MFYWGDVKHCIWRYFGINKCFEFFIAGSKVIVISNVIVINVTKECVKAGGAVYLGSSSLRHCQNLLLSDTHVQ